MRERLIELLGDYLYSEQIADHLIANGVIVPPCKVGDTVYIEAQGKIKQATVILIRPFISEKGTVFKGNVIAKIDLWGAETEHEFFVVFKEPYGIERVAHITKEEAEKVLKGGAE